MTPTTAESWRQVARERGKDAHKLQETERITAAIYMAGYVVECNLKAFLHREGKRYSTSGRAGHNLHGLWEAAGFKLNDLQGYRRIFIDTWSTELRYQQALPPNSDHHAVFEGAISLAGYIQKKIRRQRGERRP